MDDQRPSYARNSRVSDPDLEEAASDAESERSSGVRNGVAERARKIALAASARRTKYLRLGAVAVLSIGASVAVGYHVAGRVGAINPNAAWHGKIAVVARAPGAAPDAKGGITLKTAKGTNAATEGSEIGEGTEIQTDSRTRARIAFDDGTSIAIDRETRVLVESGPRTLKLEDGQIIADVAHLEGANPAKLATPNGDVAVLGTKLALTSEAERTSVEVLRGSVELRDGGGAVQIGAGEEGIAARGAQLTVAPVNDLAQRLAFGERLGLSGVHNEDTDLPVSGLGELRARRPGKTDEKDHALAIAHHGAKIRIAGNVARTEIDETFTNDTNDDLEGIYRFPLPPGAQIERLALEEKGQLIDGSFVDTQRGEAIFRGAIHNATPDQPKPKEEIIWVPGPWRDPALLEWQRGGRFELRIFPIPKHGSRRVVLAYTETVQPVAGLRRYTYPLPDAAALTIGSFDADVQVIGQDPKVGVKVRGYELTKAATEGKADRFTMSAQSFVPSGDLTVEYALDDRSTDVTAWGFVDATTPSNATPVFTQAAVKAGFGPGAPPPNNFVALAFRPKISGWTDAQPHDVVIAVDAGRSMYGERFQRARRLAVQIVQEMDRRDRVAVLACDTTCKAMAGGLVPAGSTSAHDADSFLAGVEPDGATDLVGAIRAASSISSARDASRRLRVILLSDGIASAGYRTGDRIEQEVHDALSSAHDEAVAVPIGVDADTSTLSEIARGGGGVVVPYAPGEMLETAALDVMNATYGVTLRDVELTLPSGLTDSAPAQIAPIRAGGELIVAARMAGTEVDGDAILRGKVAGEPFEARYPLHVVASSDLGNAFVPRLYASARIADEERGQVSPQARADVVDLSQRFHVASRFTSLLVLESEAMFRAFGIKRDDASSPLWTGENEATSTDVATLSPDEEKPADTGALEKDEDSFGGGADLSGTLDGWSTGASGHGRSGAGKGGGGGASAETKANPRFHAPPARPSMIAPHHESAGGDANDDESRRASEDRKKEPASTVTTTPATPTPPPAPAATASAPPQQNAQSPLDRMDPFATNKSLTGGAVGQFDSGFAGGQWMKRVWTRVAAISASSGSAVSDEKIAAARAALAAAPDERGRYVDLVHLLSAAGATEELGEVLAKWSSRDPLDDAATTARADLAARAGDRDRALRIIDGVAAGINAPSSKVSLLEALALAHERAGDKAGSCAFRLAVADVRAEAVGQKALAGTDVQRVARAVACERSDAREGSAERWVQGRAERDQILSLAGRFDSAAQSSAENTGFGDVVAEANWDSAANVDVDIAVVDPSGNRLSWMGKSSNVRVAQPTSRHRETLAVTNFSSGPFTIELVRGAGGTAPVNGTLTVRSLGQTMSIPFLLTGVRASVARVDMRLESHLVPVTSAPNQFDPSSAMSLVKNVPLATCSAPNGPNGAGRATVLFDGSGRVSNVVVSTPFSGTSVGSCVIARLSRLRVSPFTGSASVPRAFVIPP